ncbi:hypothetical protein ACVILI_000484 [Mesorhizobium sp. USDA 4775]
MAFLKRVSNVTEEDLVQQYPRLWHMAHSGAWPAIRDYGLMSAAALLDDYGVEGESRHQWGSCRRPESVPLEAKGRPGTVLRDQKPMDDGRLAGCLDDGLTPRDWYELLNSRTFFWLSRSRIWTLLRARAYRNVSQTVLTLDTARLVAAHRDRIWLSPINSGATLFKPQRRGLDTFRRIVDFPFEQRAETRRPENNVVELVVDHSVPDVADYVLAVHEVRDDQILSEIWRSPDSGPGDKP